MRSRSNHNTPDGVPVKPLCVRYVATRTDERKKAPSSRGERGFKLFSLMASWWLYELAQARKPSRLRFTPDGVRSHPMKRSQGGVRLRQWLDDERRTQEWLAGELGTYQANVSRWIRGGPPPTIEVAKAIRRITGISIEAWTEPMAAESGHDLTAVARRAS